MLCGDLVLQSGFCYASNRWEFFSRPQSDESRQFGLNTRSMGKMPAPPVARQIPQTPPHNNCLPKRTKSVRLPPLANEQTAAESIWELLTFCIFPVAYQQFYPVARVFAILQQLQLLCHFNMQSVFIITVVDIHLPSGCMHNLFATCSSVWWYAYYTYEM